MDGGSHPATRSYSTELRACTWHNLSFQATSLVGYIDCKSESIRCARASDRCSLSDYPSPNMDSTDIFVPHKTAHNPPTQFFAYENSFDGFEDLPICYSVSIESSDKGEQTPTASVSSKPFDDSSQASPGSMSSRTSWANSDIASYEDECELSESIDHKLCPLWEDRNEKVHFSNLTCALYTLTMLQIIKQPYDYVTSMPGKEIRRQLMKAFNHWYQVDETSSNIIAETVTMMHNASLL